MSRAQNLTLRLVPVAAARPGLLQAGVGSQAALGPAWTPQTAVSPLATSQEAHASSAEPRCCQSLYRPASHPPPKSCFLY